MARERILVKDAMMRVKRALKELLKLFNKPIENGEQYNELSDINILSLSLKFLAETKKIDDVLYEISEILCSSQINKIEGSRKVIIWGDEFIRLEGNDLNGAWVQPYFLYSNGDLDIDDFYDSVIYTTSRTIESLSFMNDIDHETIIKGLDFLYKIGNKIDLEVVCDKINKCVPIVQSLIKGVSLVYSNKKENYMKFLKSILDLALETDPELDSIYTQDIYYNIKLLESKKLTDEELEPIYRDIESGIFRKILKGIEILAIFGHYPPNNVNDVLLTLTSRYFKNLFKIKQTEQGIFYFSSLAESVYNILKYASNRPFAETVMNLLTEDSGWIYPRKIDPIDIYRIIIGGGLLVLARAALRR